MKAVLPQQAHHTVECQPGGNVHGQHHGGNFQGVDHVSFQFFEQKITFVNGGRGSTEFPVNVG